jgi:hypothetical protein
MASSGRVNPSPALRRSAISSSEGRNSSARLRSPGALQGADHRGVLGQALLGVKFAGADGLALQIIVAQHERGDLVGHLHEQAVAPCKRDLARAHRAVQQNLQVHFHVRGVDPGRVVDEVGVQPAAAPGELDAAELGQAEVAALADDLAVELRAVDAHGVVAAVAHVGIALSASLDVRADAAVPQEVDVRFQYRLHDLVGRGLGGQLEQRLRLTRQRQALRGA